MKLGGQGTIEYLVIISIVVVISLVVAGLTTNMFQTSSVQVNSSTDKIGSLTSGGITIVESVSDSSGDSIVRLQNSSGENLTLDKVVVGNSETIFNEQLVTGDAKSFSLNDLDLSCPCVDGQEKVSCSFDFYLTTQTGLEKKQSIITTTDCASVVLANDPEQVVGLGLGTLESPWIINSCGELQNMNDNLDGNYILANDINCLDTINWNSGIGFDPIGNNTNKFTGSLNGNSKTISDLFIYRPDTNYVGLFGYISGATIWGVSLADIDLNGLSNVGGIAGVIDSSSIITGSHTDGNITGNMYYTGGLVGSLISGNINNSYSSANINLDARFTGCPGNYSGGLIGSQFSGIVINSYSNGSICGFIGVGGLVGEQVAGDINESYFSGDIGTNNSATDSVGGFVGIQRASGIISDCYSTGTLRSVNAGGGFVGAQSGFITNSYALGNVTGGTKVGGFAGSMSATGIIVKSFSDGNVSGTSAMMGSYYSGGFVGYLASGTINDSYSTGSVTRRAGTGLGFGGFAGSNYRGKIINSYSLGNVIYANALDGVNPTNKGFLGTVDTGTGYQMSGNFWDFNTSLQLTTSGTATGKTTTQMKTASTFSAWDSTNTWDLVESEYPALKWETE